MSGSASGSSLDGPADGQPPWLAEHDASRRRRVRLEPEVRPPVEGCVEGGPGLESGQMDTDAGMRTLRERDMGPCLRAVQVEPVRIREERRVAVRARQRHDHQVPAADAGATELDVRRGIAIDASGSGLQAKRL